ncbi:lysine N(6)-hydroxylase/L-ornithine N(5)-oxygenase family protein [Streptomyces sp. RY43-2]|uniref:L-lysine N6-monooxygenase MbtG n=1 Tax=Streptomyces macrolidinus TaxID=2952607 RepID=A0ABT0ZJ21_9ACTN|nr:lysine N(6)-hydroxylase/L-ornithine N(5)-oxygenase family protein [Streptomyces macrolidinus]MCN9243556.1 lysine N(6)-hydroxylase/L-ornithine N(5)-oxygenase family protein [Streptomyces macrolidinus]
MQDTTRILDVAGIGFGPSNLALAIALRERGEEAPSAAFFDRSPSFGWHRGMLIDDATMQISYLKDLVTLRDPTSSFSFLCYLKDRGRLVDFINHQILVPSRTEFHDYLAWAAARFPEVVSYGSEVTAVRPVPGEHAIDCVELVIRDVAEPDRTRTCLARNLVLATGLRMALPDGVELSERVWHSSEFLHRLAELPPAPERSFTVVGAGQSAAEVTNHLLGAFPDARVHAVFSRYGYSVADDSPFANRIFDPAAVDDYYLASPEVRQSLMRYHGNANYSVVDLDLIKEIYRRQYQDKVAGVHRLRIANVSRVRAATPVANGVDVQVEFLPNGEVETVNSDVVIFATGYRPADPMPLLGELGDFIELDDEGMLRVDRNYRAVTSEKLACGIYLQGATEHTHGISSSLLSMTAVRSGEIAESLCAAVRPTS